MATTLSTPAPQTHSRPLRHAWSDTATMVRRQFVHAARYPVWIFLVVAPVAILLLAVFVFGGTLGRGLGGDAGDYLDYIMPGMIVLTIAGGMQLTALSVSQDMNEGIVTRFRSMSISRGAVMAGHVIGNGLQQCVAIVLVILVGVAIGFRPHADVVGWLGFAGFAAAIILALGWLSVALGVTAKSVEVAIGFRPHADVVGWLGFAGFAAAIILALGWLSVALGVTAKSVESASNLPMIFMLLPMIGSGFVPTDTMPGWIQAFADWQPFTPIIETVRGLLMGTPIGADWWIALLWLVGIGILGYVLARVAYERRAAQ
ncbi:ABC transporter permease [Brevibacterium casei]|uniref:Transport permease protein n=1 Tax=Brevibacterium casei TaxID=33889 RepID=A0AB34XRY6_9MICO|nr:ABC transporter permease [Brevibacterium casei]KZE17177.1 ABC transporter permease [Brevibacterium casei]